MMGKLVYITNDKYISLFDARLEFLDYSIHEEIKKEEDLRDIFKVEIAEQEGDFKILIDPKDLPLKEITYHKDIVDINTPLELNLRYDCSDKNDFFERINNMMKNSEEVLDSLFNRFADYLDENEEYKLKLLETFLEDRSEDKESYLFARELDEFCKNIYEKEKEKQKTIGG